MARFKDVSYKELGKYIRELIKDPVRQQAVLSGEKDIAEELAAFMTPQYGNWNAITVIPHFDTATEVHVSFPFTDDVEASIEAIAPEEDDQAGEPYEWPKHYEENPNTPGPNGESVKEKRLRLYHCRVGDYVMTRCR